MAFPSSCPIFGQSAELTPLPHSPSLSVLSLKGVLSVVKCNRSLGNFWFRGKNHFSSLGSVTRGPHQSLSQEARERKEVLFRDSILIALRKSSGWGRLKPNGQGKGILKYKASFLRELFLVLFLQANSGFYLSGPR